MPSAMPAFIRRTGEGPNEKVAVYAFPGAGGVPAARKGDGCGNADSGGAGAPDCVGRDLCGGGGYGRFWDRANLGGRNGGSGSQCPWKGVSGNRGLSAAGAPDAGELGKAGGLVSSRDPGL